MSHRLILLAHPDDEMLCLPHLIADRSSHVNKDVYVYLTFGSMPLTRKEEARNAVILMNQLVRLSYLIEIRTPIRDGRVWSEFSIKDFEDIVRICNQEEISEILTFAYEGGHQDHDFACAVAYKISAVLGLKVNFFGGYRKAIRWPFFVVSSPLRKRDRIFFSKRHFFQLFMSLACVHRSQYLVWLLLAPGIMFRALFLPTYSSEGLNSYLEKPLQSRPLYDVRRKSKKNDVEESIIKLVAFAPNEVNNG